MSIESRIENLETKMDIIILTLQRIEKKLSDVEVSCDGMDGHIEFVESVYSTVRHPLNFLVKKIQLFTTGDGENHESLPLLENREI